MTEDEIRMECLRLAMAGGNDVRRIDVVRVAHLYSSFVLAGIDAAEVFHRKVNSPPLASPQ